MRAFAAWGKSCPLFDAPPRRVWDVATGKELRGFEGKAEGVSAMALSAGGKFAVVGGLIRQSGDDTLKFWDVTAGKELSVTGGRAEFVSMAAR